MGNPIAIVTIMLVISFNAFAEKYTVIPNDTCSAEVDIDDQTQKVISVVLKTPGNPDIEFNATKFYERPFEFLRYDLDNFNSHGGAGAGYVDLRETPTGFVATDASGTMYRVGGRTQMFYSYSTDTTTGRLKKFELEFMAPASATGPSFSNRKCVLAQ